VLLVVFHLAVGWKLGPAVERRVDLLGGLIACVCGRRLRNDGTFADGRHRKHHPDPCEVWGRKARLGDETWVSPVLSQVAGIALDQDTMESVVAALGSVASRSRSTGPGSIARCASSRLSTQPAASATTPTSLA
jgi:hypothetical protein